MIENSLRYLRNFRSADLGIYKIIFGGFKPELDLAAHDFYSQIRKTKRAERPGRGGSAPARLAQRSAGMTHFATCGHAPCICMQRQDRGSYE
jgi:hypothetical protein